MSIKLTTGASILEMRKVQIQGKGNSLACVLQLVANLWKSVKRKSRGPRKANWHPPEPKRLRVETHYFLSCFDVHILMMRKVHILMMIKDVHIWWRRRMQKMKSGYYQKALIMYFLSMISRTPKSGFQCRSMRSSRSSSRLFCPAWILTKGENLVSASYSSVPSCAAWS